MTTSLPDNDTNNNNCNDKLYILDPLSVIIKLAIIGDKPVGTKIRIQNNVVYIQEPGIFQSLCRMLLNTNKTDLHYMYNPIQYACLEFLSPKYKENMPRMELLFNSAMKGIQRLIDTYKKCSIITLCLNYYYAIIITHLEKYNETVDEPLTNTDCIFYKDVMNSLYTTEVITELNKHWTDDKITVILDLVYFLNKDNMAINNVKSLETIMENNDINTQTVLLTL
jgi:hypothetical protein